jgi:hypothetical protein
MNAGYTGSQKSIEKTDREGPCSNWAQWPNNKMPNQKNRGSQIQGASISIHWGVLNAFINFPLSV